MSAEPYICVLDPDTKTTFQMYLFRNVQNVEKVRSNVLKGLWACAVIKPSLIIDPFQVAVAANRAVVSERQNNMVTRTVYGEILYNLSLTKNISQSLSKFGLERDRDMLVCFLVTAENDNSKEILAQIEGEISPMSDLSVLIDLKQVKSVYRLSNLKSDVGLLDIIVSRMVTKNFVSH